MKKSQSGFTLVEIAIVLVIIGLLLGGVLKGQELITQAKIKNVANDLNGLTSAVYSYQDRYKRFPGDDSGAKRWPLLSSATVGDGDNVVSGAYNSTDDKDESRLFWAGLRLAGFVAGAVDSIAAAATQPVNAAGGITGVQTGALGLVGLLICTDGLPTKIAQSIDSQFDDGSAKTGSVRAVLMSTTALSTSEPTADYVDDSSKLYILCKNI